MFHGVERKMSSKFRSSFFGLRSSVFRLQAVKNLARFIRSEINVAARLEGNAKKKERTNEERNTKKKQANA